MLLYLLLGVLVAQLGWAEISLWDLDGDHLRRLEDYSYIKENHYLLSEKHVVSLDRELFHGLEKGSQVSFRVPGSSMEEKVCELSEGRSSVKGLKKFSCLTEELEELKLFMTNGHLSGLFIDKYGKRWALEKAFKETNEFFMIYNEAEAENLPSPTGTNAASLKPPILPSAETIQRSLGRKLGQTDGTGIIFKFAVLVSPTFSQDAVDYYNDDLTLENVAAIIERTMASLNGIFARQVGVYFQLIDNFTDGICVTEDQSSICGDLPENHITNWYLVANYLTDLGIASTDYDLAHRLVAEGGSRGYTGALCRTGIVGAIGSAGGFRESTFLRNFAQSVGSQMNAELSFKDCSLYEDDTDFSQATEPGAGTTIMSYAGSCGEDNQLQTWRDSYFNSYSTVVMREFAEGKCGEVITLTDVVPTLTVPPAAVIPIGNYFQIVGDSSSADATESFYTWERIDTGFEDFSNDTLGRMRMYEPAQNRRARFMPNLWFLNYDQDESAEKLPEIEVDWNLRFMERSKYVEDSTTFPTIIGDYAYEDTTVSFRDYEPMSLLSPQSNANISLSSPIEFEIHPGDLPELTDGKIQVWFAVNTMRLYVDAYWFHVLDYLEDLEWVLLEERRMRDSDFTIRVRTSAEELGLDGYDYDFTQEARGNFMIRTGMTGDGEMYDAGLYVFDLITGVTFYEEPDDRKRDDDDRDDKDDDDDDDDRDDKDDDDDRRKLNA